MKKRVLKPKQGQLTFIFIASRRKGAALLLIPYPSSEEGVFVKVTEKDSTIVKLFMAGMSEGDLDNLVQGADAS